MLRDRPNLDSERLVDGRPDPFRKGGLQLRCGGLEALQELVARGAGRNRRQDLDPARIRRHAEGVDGGVDAPFDLFADGLAVDDAQDVLGETVRIVRKLENCRHSTPPPT